MGPRQLVQAWVEAFNRADVDALAAFYADDATNHQVAESPVRGRENIRRMFASGFASASMHCIVENIFEEGQWAILEWRDPNGLRGCGFFHVVDGRISFQRGYWDKLSFLRLRGPATPGQLAAIEHVQLAMPAGAEPAARKFYQDVLGIPEVPKPPHLAKRGGAWFERGALKVHLGVETDFRPARKAHVAFLVADLGGFIRHLRNHGVDVVDDPLDGYLRVYISDPFGNRIELMEPLGNGNVIRT
ncbi:MAG TPA: nuclear transport factor 2 family protein [Steroidobacteraceae bacterium]|nr:nuclear transport factor 2 family protein [Steroidobacteraceae bacterium]